MTRDEEQLKQLKDQRDELEQEVIRLTEAIRMLEEMVAAKQPRIIYKDSGKNAHRSNF